MSVQKTNLVLIGMAGAGKSTVGPLLARMLSYDFIDVDELIEADQQQSLQEIVDRYGPEWFRLLEERIILGLDVQCHVIATGGSAVYGAAGMTHLQQQGMVVFLDVPLAILEGRVDDVATRGLARQQGQSFADLLAERQPLYSRYADIIIECAAMSLVEIGTAIVERITESPA